MPRNSQETRNSILKAAEELFYREGLRSVSVDAIAKRAGITKKSLYYHFPSKDHLITAYLEAADSSILGLYQKWLEEFEGSLGERLAGMFGKIATWAKNPRWRGCGFARAAAELAGAPGHPALAVASRHKKGFEMWFERLLLEEGVFDARLVARQMMVLLDGAVTEILIHRDPCYAQVAGEAAMVLIQAAKRKGRTTDVRRAPQESRPLSRAS